MARTVYDDIADERALQDKEWGGKDHDDEHAATDWCYFIAKHNERARDASMKHGDDARYRYQLVRVAALAVAAIEAHDRSNGDG